ncbi:hypothetical protein K438DRAFT_1973043 [Mycena galopus ATCC 62051]|nr:hypothetical protein K438DRAFT_1973043 [Mycena galopus ATCC 62051]
MLPSSPYLPALAICLREAADARPSHADRQVWPTELRGAPTDEPRALCVSRPRVGYSAVRFLPAALALHLQTPRAGSISQSVSASTNFKGGGSFDPTSILAPHLLPRAVGVVCTELERMVVASPSSSPFSLWTSDPRASYDSQTPS